MAEEAEAVVHEQYYILEMRMPMCSAEASLYESLMYCQSTGTGHAQVLQNLIVLSEWPAIASLAYA